MSITMPRLFYRLILPVLGLLGIGAALLTSDWWIAVPLDKGAEYVGRESCVDCHEPEHELWVGSDHDRAMALATPETVLADFNDQEFVHFGVTSKMSREGDKFVVTTDDRDGNLQRFEVKYTFGVRPLQQYLVEFPDGRVQCLPLAWDTEKERWFHLYPDEPVPHDDPLHWTGPLQNWNYMCAECHSTDLQKNYDLKTDTYHTTFKEIDVSCETCHGPGSLHVELAESKGVFWDRRIGYGLPNLKDKDPRVEIETCAPCHARRRIIYPGFKPGDKFLDYYVPELLDRNLYYADGQILEEDYVYGSFIQSKMYHNEVRCSDCHDPHSAKVKFDDNRLCGQCHLPTTYDTPKHHHHPDSKQPGTLCVECHMPETTYMVVDPRRDHSLRIPRPDLTVSLGIPNACNGCHQDKAKGETPEWAVEKVNQWYGEPKGPPHFAHAIAAGREGKPEGEALLMDVTRRKGLSATVRASALLLLARYGTPDAWAAARAGLEDPEALVRVSAVRALQNGPPEIVGRRVPPLLVDPIRSVRVEAARVLSMLPPEALARKDRDAMKAALAEYFKGQEAVDDQPAAHLNMAVVHANLGHAEDAAKAYETALRLDPAFVPARVNLAMLHDQLGNKQEAERELRKVIAAEPKMADAHYSLALLLAEDESRLDEAARSLATAAKLAPDNARIRYNHGLALQKLGKAVEAERELLAAHRLLPHSPDFLHALAILYTQQKQWDKAVVCAERLLRLRPDDPGARALLQQLRQQAEPKGKSGSE